MNKNIAIIALESSADKLGSYLIADLKKYNSQINFWGIGGDKMKAQGLKAFYSIEDLSFIGIISVIKNIKKILNIKKSLYNKILAINPDLIIGIDSSSFNLPLERKFKKQGIKVIHYVSPQVWAWRPWRAKKFHRSFNLLLLLYPFEKKFYQNYNINYKYVGYPFMPIEQKNYFNLDQNKKTIAILPGSRKSEIIYLLPIFLKVAQELDKKYNLQFIVPLANSLVKQCFYEIYNKLNINLDLKIINNQAHEVIASSYLVLCASGTASLEAMLLEKPTVVCYKTDFLTYLIVRMLIQVKYIAITNILANKEIFPECIQKNCTVEKVYAAIDKFLSNKDYYNNVLNNIKNIKLEVTQGGECSAAEAVISHC